MTKSEIVQQTGFTMPTVTRITDKFIQDGLVKVIGKRDSVGGRKPALLSLNLDTYGFIGVSVDDKVRSVVTNIRGEIQGISNRSLKEAIDTRQVVDEIRKCMEESIEKAKIGREKIAYAGIGIPGTRFKNIFQKQKQLFSPWVNTSYKELDQMGNFPYPVVFANAVRMGAAGEFGHMIINYGGPVCYCGNRGCVESYCSTGALLEEYAIECAADGGNRQKAGKIDFKDFVEMVQAGDEAACRVARRVGSLLGIGVGNAINLYNPEAVVFGGELGGGTSFVY